MAFGQAPTITSQPRDKTVNPGASATLSVTASGAAPLHYQWQLNGENIPGQNSSTITFANAQPTDGGTYSVVVFNSAGAVKSANATLLVNAPALAFSDNLSPRDRVMFSPSDTRSGSNAGATSEPGEPDHAGKEGGHSVWMGWIAPANGTVTFHTRGSSFDTLLAAYRGSVVVNLSLVVANDDHGPGVGNPRRGPGFTSQITFNVTNGVEYLIAVDGRAGATGNIVLSWNLVEGTPDFPEITYQPEDQPIQTNMITVFYVGDSGASSYQWYSNAVIKVGATASGINATGVPGELGFYTVFVTRNGRSLESDPAVLEIVTHSATATKDKFEDVLEDGEGVSLSLPVPPSKNPGSKIVSIAAGAAGYQIFNNSGSSSDADEPLHAGMAGGASRWQAILPQNNGVLELDTAGSDPDTVIAVYTGDSYVSLHLVAEDNNSGADNKSALVRFPCTAGTRYIVAVDTVGGVTGVIHLNWRLGDYPQLSQPAVRVFYPGEFVALSVDVSGGVGPFTYQWSKDDAIINGATSPYLYLGFPGSDANGYYKLTVNTLVGPITSTIHLVQISEKPFLVTEPEDALVPQGSTLNFSAYAVASDGFPVRYQWQYKKKSIRGATNTTYSIANALVRHSGAYRVIATTEAGSVTSMVANARVLIPVSVKTPPKQFVVGNSRKATFKVKAAGSPPLSYQWQFNEVDIPNATGPTYVIPNVQSPLQLGPYRVVVRNDLGPVTSLAAQLLGLEIKTQPHDTTVTLGKKFSLKVKVIGPAPLRYQWRKNGIIIPGENGATYTVASATADAAGVYSVDVGSPLVTTYSSSAVVTVTGAMAPVHRSSSSQLAQLVIESPSDGALQIILRGIAGVTYQLEASEDLLHWKSIGELTPGTDGQTSFRDESSGPKRFYRALTK